MDEVDPALLDTFNRLGIPLEEQKVLSGMAVDAVMDSVSVKTTHRERLAELGIIFCSFSEAVRESTPTSCASTSASCELPRQFLCRAKLCRILRRFLCVYPQGCALPYGTVDILPHQRLGHGQFERTLIVADDDAYVSYLEGCTALRCATRTSFMPLSSRLLWKTAPRSSTPPCRTGMPATLRGRGGVYNFVTKRGLCRGDYSKLSLDAGRDRLGYHMEIPLLHPCGEGAVGEFYSVAVTNNYQQADTGTKMVHTGSNTRSTIVSKGISAGHSENSYRGLVKVAHAAKGAKLHPVRLATAQ